MMNTYALMALMLFCATSSQAQTMKPATKGPIKLELDESGRVKEISSYGVTKWTSYDVTLKYDAPKKTHEKFITDLGKKLLNAHEILTEEFNTSIHLYTELWGAGFQKIKDDLSELGNLLTQPDAETNLNAKPADAYPFLGGKDFLYK